MSLCVLGSVNQDVVCRVAQLPRPGETVSASGVRLFQGGKGANQAIAAARMGAQVRLLGAVGTDAAGTGLLGELAAAGVDIRMVRRLDDVPTGAAYIALAADGENQIVVSPGANARVRPEDVGDIGDARVLLAQLETPVPAIAAFFAAAGASRTRILNPAPALPDGAALFEAADLIILNQTELATYLRLAEPPRTAEAAIVARRLLLRHGQAAIVTLGAGGAVLVEQDGWRHVPAPRVDVVDTTGAGDCFCGALAALIAEGRSPRDALAMASAAAALAVQREGAGPAMPRRAEVDRFAAAATEYAPSIKTVEVSRLGSVGPGTKGRR